MTTVCECVFVCSEPNADDWSNAMLKLCTSTDMATKMGQYGHQRVIDKFSFNTFKTKLHNIVTELASHRYQKRSNTDNVVYVSFILIVVALIVITLKIAL